MAAYSGKHTAYVATAASVGADVVVLTGNGFSVRVINEAGSAPLYFTASHPGGACPVPTVGETSNAYVVPATVGGFASTRGAFQFGAVVQVVSSGTTSYSVELQGNHATS